MIYLRLFHQQLRKGASVVNKVLLVIGIFLAISGFFLKYHYQDLPQKPDTKTEIRKNVYKNIAALEKNGSKNKIALSLYKFTNCLTIGEACSENPKDGDKNYDSSILGFLGNSIALPYTNPPSSGIAWLNDGLQNVGFVPHTYAAGIGFYSISAFSTVWKVFRNITFFVMAIAIVAIGFMIMFRVKIDSQTVINIENSLPRIVITLLLITFSFAIAGFLIDLMYILIIIAINILGNSDMTGITDINPGTLQPLYLTNQIPLWEGFWGQRYTNLYVEGIHGLIDFIPDLVRQALGIVVYVFSYLTLSNLLLRFQDTFNLEVEGSIIVASLKGNAGALIYFIVINIFLFVFIPILIWWVIPWILGITIMLFLFFRILFMLISAYVQIVISIIFAPVLILPNVIPGNDAFMKWLKGLIGNLLTFPITIVLLIVVQLIGLNDEVVQQAMATNGISQTQFSFPMLTMKTSALIPVIVAVFLLIIPQLVKKVTESIAGPPIVEAGAGTLFAGIGGAVGTVIGQYAGLASFANSMRGSRVGNMLGFIPGIRGAKGPTAVENPDRTSTQPGVGSAIDAANENANG